MSLEDNRPVNNSIFQRKVNNTGLPNNLKSGIESLSGIDMSDTKVHYNSSKPAQLNAHAYAQGTDIHLASGQEKHLPHEAWHVVQQKQGRVKPTMQMKGKVNINDDKGLEREADVMGEKAANTVGNSSQNLGFKNENNYSPSKENIVSPVAQCYFDTTHPMNIAVVHKFVREERTDLLEEFEEILESEDEESLEDWMYTNLGFSHINQVFDWEEEHDRSNEGFRLPLNISTMPDTGGSLFSSITTGDEELKEADAEPVNFLGEDPFINRKGGTVLSRTPSIVRQDSLGALIPVPGTQVHRDLRIANLDHSKVAKQYTSNSNVNVFKLGVSLTIRLPDGSIVSKSNIIPEYWNSGLDQQTDERDTSQVLTDYYKEMKEQEGLNAKPPEDAFTTSSSKANYAALFAHSETNAASDPRLDVFLRVAAMELISGLPYGSVLLTATLEGDSAPNSVCTNACRPAINFIRQRLDGIIKKIVALRAASGGGFLAKSGPKLRLSRSFETDARVSSVKLFAGKMNPDLKSARSSRDPIDYVDTPVILGDPITLEIFPDQLTSAKGTASYEKKRETTTTTIDAASARGEIISWAQENKGNSIVGQLMTCEDINDVYQIIAKADLSQLDSLWSKFKDKIITNNFKRAALLIIGRLFLIEKSQSSAGRGDFEMSYGGESSAAAAAFGGQSDTLSEAERQDYDGHIFKLRMLSPELVKQSDDQSNFDVYKGYELSPEQMDAIRGRTLLQTPPDGDCSINAVTGSLHKNTHPLLIRKRIAQWAFRRELIQHADIEKIKEPGEFSGDFSAIILQGLANIESVDIVIIRSDGERREIKPDEPAENGTVTIVHVNGESAQGHFYGTQG